MCGIIAYKGINNPKQVILDGLKKLEYRGYDSWGIAVKDNVFEVTKETGPVEDVFFDNMSEGKSGTQIGIGHTRWATTGVVSRENAHPHLSNKQEFALVHNGIVENYQDIKNRLIKKGYIFNSETDSEVIVNLIEDHYYRVWDYLESVRLAFLELAGRNAIVVMHKRSEDIIAVRDGSPLVIGEGENELFIASDMLAFANHTKDIKYLDDGEIAVLNSKARFLDLKTLAPKEKEQSKIDWEYDMAQKNNYTHFMLKEIMEQPESLKKTLVRTETELAEITDAIKNSKNIVITGAGTAGQVSNLGQYLFSYIAQRKVDYISAAELSHFLGLYGEGDCLLVISQSGETADCLRVMELAERKGMKIVSIVNVKGSSIDRKSSARLYLNAGVEKAVASTKATSAQMILVALLAYSAQGNFLAGLKILNDFVDKVAKVLSNDLEFSADEVVKEIINSESIYILGRGLNYPIAKEASIKIQEVGYAHAEGFAGAELKHGPLALITKGTPVIFLSSNDGEQEALISNAQEVKSRGGYVIGIGYQENSVYDRFIKVPDAGFLGALMNLFPVQVIAYKLSVARGINPDKPRNLAKSVTVL